MRTENLSDREILGPILHPTDQVGDNNIDTAEGCLARDNTYRWYHGLARVLRPKRVAEIGVRFGYSLYALQSGSLKNLAIYGFDNESYIPDCLSWARLHLKPLAWSCELVKCDTQKLNALSLLGIDIFHVDGDHTAEGADHDMKLAWPTLADNGVLLVDDVDSIPPVRAAVVDFCDQHHTEFLYLPSTRGLAVIPKA